MAMPPRDLGDLLMTDWAQATLLFPKMEKPLFPLEGVYPFYVETCFVVAFPCRVVRIGLSTDLCMPFDWHVCGGCEIMRLFFCGSEKHPVVSSEGFEVFLRNPLIGFAWVSSFHPPSYRSIDLVVSRIEGFFADSVLVIERPSSNERVKLHDQFSSTQSFIGLHDVPYLF